MILMTVMNDMTVDTTGWSDTGRLGECVSAHEPTIRIYDNVENYYNLTYCVYQAGLFSVQGPDAYDMFKMCSREGLQPATINTIEELTLFNTMIKKTKIFPQWLGAKEYEHTTTYYWFSNGILDLMRPVTLLSKLNKDEKSISIEGTTSDPYLVIHKNPDEWLKTSSCQDVVEFLDSDFILKRWNWRCNVACEKISIY